MYTMGHILHTVSEIVELDGSVHIVLGGVERLSTIRGDVSEAVWITKHTLIHPVVTRYWYAYFSAEVVVGMQLQRRSEMFRKGLSSRTYALEEFVDLVQFLFERFHISETH